MTAPAGAVTGLLGQQSQAGQLTGSGQLDPQEILDSIIRSLPDIIRVVSGVVSGQSVGPPSVGPQSVDPVGGSPGHLDPQGILDGLLGAIFKTVTGVLGGLSVGPQSVGPVGGSAGQLDPQGIFDSIIRSLPDIIRVVSGVVSGQSAAPQSVGPQSVSPLSGPDGQVDPQFLQFILPLIPSIISAATAIVNAARR
jgi:hypothetical protein